MAVKRDFRVWVFAERNGGVYLVEICRRIRV